MEQLIPVEDKRIFLKWFLSHYQLKNRECVWLLNYILGDDRLTGLLKFVDNIKNCPRAMAITEYSMPEAPFMYRKQHVACDSTEKAFHDIRLHQDEPIFLKLNFPAAFHSLHYIAVLEENPHDDENVNDLFGDDATRVLTKAKHEYKEKDLYKNIDEALDRGDEQAFFHYSEELKKLKKSKVNNPAT